MKISFEIEIENGELARSWKDEIADVVSHYFKMGDEVSVQFSDGPMSGTFIRYANGDSEIIFD